VAAKSDNVSLYPYTPETCFVIHTLAACPFCGEPEAEVLTRAKKLWAEHEQRVAEAQEPKGAPN
jgi:hypothetical protein